MQSRAGQNSRASVLVVDDEPTISEVVARYLVRAGYDTRIAGDGAQALALHNERAADLIVLDVMMPHVSGVEVLRRLRRDGGDAPAVIMLTARGEESDRITGLALGADDYVVKPFSPRELVARVDAVLRRVRPAQSAPVATDVIEAGDLRIDPAGRRVTRGSEEVQLTQREFDLLLYLAASPGTVFSRDQLMNGVWGHDFYTDTSTVTVHVRRLRQKLERDPAEPEFVQTVWGVGYRFDVPASAGDVSEAA
ncbi:MAG: response regulator transcription factor [Solirubrobacteraceae bacterium]|nr:response regulator transcription factor [Solirubrobacteraceae bacterium]